MSSKRRVIALGFFDGVHTGHGALLRTAREVAATQDAVATGFTFDQHPASVITGEKVSLISTVADRGFLMRHYYQIDEMVISQFDVMMCMDWKDFVTQYLVKELNVCHIVAGHDFHFGYMGKGNPHRLSQLCQSIGLGCDIIPKVEEDGITVSSTYIRNLIAQGEMDRAVHFLGHPHTLTGQIGHGKQLGGRVLGFPTTNLKIPSGIIVPALGVYASRVHVAGKTHMAVTNVGVRPSVRDSDGQITVESFILDFQGDLYGQPARVEFFSRLREERKFQSYEALTLEISRNVDQTRTYFSQFPIE